MVMTLVANKKCVWGGGQWGGGRGGQASMFQVKGMMIGWEDHDQISELANCSEKHHASSEVQSCLYLELMQAHYLIHTKPPNPSKWKNQMEM